MFLFNNKLFKNIYDFTDSIVNFIVPSDVYQFKFYKEKYLFMIPSKISLHVVNANSL